MNPHEYNGIALYGDSIWTTYAGTWSGDSDPNDPNTPVNPAVISSSRIDW